jgi:2-methylaconitate cis-trans-isomerase PrpF
MVTKEDRLVDSKQAMEAMEAMEATVMEDSLVDLEQALEEAMNAMEATAIDLGSPMVVLAVTREVGQSSIRASRAVENTNNRARAAISSRVAGASVVGVEAHISIL